ncbi:MAG: kynureninase [Deltaproteobacteria bacterium]|nr:kynureninase [Deltaproteobacteria bacterium]
MALLCPDEITQLDSADPLASFRNRFALPEGIVYLDGNSLGPLPRETPQRLQQVVEDQWGRDLIRSWNTHGWIDLPNRVGAKIARLLGASEDEVIVADSTSVNLFKLAAAALREMPHRRVILTEASNFPTDLYMLQGLANFLGDGHQVRLVPPQDIEKALSEEVALLCLSQVNFRTGALHDVASVTRAAHRHGCLVLWDLAHSAGALPVELTAWKVDLAVGCGYKFLNGGPGAPSFAYVRRELQDRLEQPLQGWLGHRAPFAFEPTYRPAPGIQRILCGTPPILSLVALESGVDLLLEADLTEIRAKSMAMGDFFIRLVKQRCGDLAPGLASPSEASHRGSQISLRHPQAFAICQAWIARGVIADFRAPDILRCGLAPLYLSFGDLWRASQLLGEILESEAWNRPAFFRRSSVT